MDWFTNFVKAAGDLVDKACPVLVGRRTETSAVLFGLLKIGLSFVPGPWVPFVSMAASALTALVPVFGAASIARSIPAVK